MTGVIIRTSMDGKRYLRIKGARHAHITIRKQGRIPGAEAREAHKRYAKERRELKAAAKPSPAPQVGYTLTGGY